MTKDQQDRVGGVGTVSDPPKPKEPVSNERAKPDERDRGGGKDREPKV